MKDIILNDLISTGKLAGFSRSLFVTLDLVCLLLFAAFLMTACAPQPAAETAEQSLEEKEALENVATPEAAKRQPLYIYNEKGKEEKKVSLQLKSEPRLLSINQGEPCYVSLAGIVEASEPIALLDIAGKSRSVVKSDLVGKYKVTAITIQGLKMELRDD